MRKLLSANGRWNEDEKACHINVLELLAVLYALRTLEKETCSCHIKINSDNSTTVSYVNKMGGRKIILNGIAQEIWKWYVERNIWLTAVHVPGIYNKAADTQSREFGDSNKEWKLNQFSLETFVVHISILILTCLQVD